MDQYRQSNRELWNHWAELHQTAEMYDAASFKAGNTSLHPLELEEIGDVSGKTLLHLQCHFGRDTLSWARLGAIATGADFSNTAIDIARKLSDEIGVPATFVLSELYDLPNNLTGQFDIVFTSYGAIYWLPDIAQWARVVAHFLKPGGTFYIAEFHPFHLVLEGTPDGKELRITYPYRSPAAQPLSFDVQGSYAAPDPDYHATEYGWNHSLGEIVTSLAEAGLNIEFLHEHHFSGSDHMFKGMERGDDGYYRLTDPLLRDAIPLMFSLRAVKRKT
jgi:SAM-dependent methyltransferase